MKKTIIALGGGTFGEHKDTYKNWELPLPAGQTHYDTNTTPVDRLILKATGKASPKVLLVTTASEDGSTDIRLLEEAFRSQYTVLGAQVDTLKLTIEKPSLQEIQDKIEATDAVYASGGSTYLMMRTWRRLKVDKLLSKAYEKGTVMAGMSAGSICWFKYGNSNSFYTDKPFRVTGMGWFNLLICPHYDTEPFRQPAMQKMMKRSPSTVGIALDEHAALEIVDDTYRIHFFKPGAKVRKCYWRQGKYIKEQLKSQEAYAPLEELLNS